MAEKNLLNYSHDQLKNSIVRMLKARKADGGRGSIKRSRLQPELTRFEGCTPVLGNPRKSVDANLNRAIAALRLEKKPRLQKDRGDDLIRLV